MLFLILHLAVGEILFPITIDESSRIITLPNSLEVALISCKDCSESGVSMGVKVGALHDPFSGLAHFLEHMLFYSSDTYPEEDYLMDYIRSHGGYSNAYTAYTATVFYYSISHDSLQESLHIFSRSFVEPIFLNETAFREMLAVNSEMQRDIHDEGWIQQRLMEIAMGMPFEEMTIGDLSTLSRANITDELYAFWDKHYRARNMKLAVYGNYSLDTLETWVTDMYSDIREGGEFEALEGGDSRGNLVEIETTFQGKAVIMFWKLYPGDFVQENCDFIGYLLRYSLGKAVSSEYSLTHIEADRYTNVGVYSIFYLSVVVDEPSVSTETLCGTIRGAINSIWSLDNFTLFSLWEDYRTLNYYDFYYADPLAAYEIASALAYNMLFFEEDYYFVGNLLAPAYSLQNLQNVLSQFSGENFVTIVYSYFPEYETNAYEETFEIDYFITNWTVAANDMIFTHLEKNPFLPHDLKLINDSFSSELQVIEDTDFRVWFEYNYSFKKPIVIISAIITPESWNQYKLLGMVHCSIVLEMALTRLNYWFLAGYSLEIEATLPGIEINVSGWNQGIFEFFEEVLKLYTNPDISRFSAMHEASLITLLSYNSEESYIKAKWYLSRLINPYTMLYSEQYTLLFSYNISAYLNFLETLSNSSIDGLVLGNIAPPNTLPEILSKYFTRATIDKLYRHSLGITGYNIFTAPGYYENAIINWYEFGKYNQLTFAAMHIFAILTKNKAFVALRSQAQLGYTVILSESSVYMVNAVYLAVQGSYYNPEEMQEFINEFWAGVTYSEEEIEEAKESFRNMNGEPNNYEELYEDLWFEIESGRFQFEDRANIREAIENVGLEDMLMILRGIQEHENELSIRMYANITESTENSISLDYFRQQSISIR